MNTRSLLTPERLREALHYDPDTGVFTWRVKPNRRIRIGDVAGTKHSEGYWLIRIDGYIYFAHRAAWLYVYGAWPTDQIDHISGVKTDNRRCNLREATVSENGQNQRAPKSHNTSGFLGVSWHKASGAWRAVIGVSRKQRHLGNFPTAEEAHAAYLQAKRELHTHCTI